MAQLRSEKMEKFAQARARGLSLTASAREAGYSPNTCPVRGHEMGQNPQVLARVAELRAKLDEKLVERVTADRTAILDAIGELVQEAREARDRPTAMRGLELLGRSIGLFQERAPEARSPLEGMTADQLLAVMRTAEALLARDEPPTLHLVAGGAADAA